MHNVTLNEYNSILLSRLRTTHHAASSRVCWSHHIIFNVASGREGVDLQTRLSGSVLFSGAGANFPRIIPSTLASSQQVDCPGIRRPIATPADLVRSFRVFRYIDFSRNWLKLFGTFFPIHAVLQCGDCPLPLCCCWQQWQWQMQDMAAEHVQEMPALRMRPILGKKSHGRATLQLATVPLIRQTEFASAV